ncbi:MAG TPA: hypothetical protein VN851_14415 [Thermoanaerobaculia bacterium]|nr:hypothetical protein [Thermoanaerobaculia bacterium]
MRAEYDFSTLEGRKNTYARRLKKQVVAEGDKDDDFDGGLTEARAAADRGEGITTEELRRRLGIAESHQKSPK